MYFRCDERMALVTGLDMIFGGVDSVAHSTAFALHHLAVNQNAQNKIYQELDDEASSTTYFKVHESIICSNMKSPYENKYPLVCD